MRPHRLVVFLLPLLLAAQNLQEFEKKVTEFTLANGLHFIVVERHEAPVVSFHTYVNAGSADDPSGATGIAHMFEHMAFKGTESIGSKNWPEEEKAIDQVEAVYDRLDAETNKGVKADPQKVAAIQAELKAAQEKSDALVEPNLYPRVIEQNGGEGMNAQTSWDSTEYFYSLPSNRLELWFLLESQRFIQPVFREFYKERDVVMEEYRMRVESEPQGKLMQAFLATAFSAFPYRIMGTGWPSDVAHLRRADARRFFHEYYVPGNITLGIVGDVDPAAARRLAEKYFGPMQSRPLPPLLHTQEPTQEGPKRAEVESPSQPLLFVGYKRPDEYSKEDPVFDVIGGILSSGRTGLLYKELVRDKQIALEADADDTFPGGKYPNLFLFFLAPAAGHTTAENEKALYEVLEKFKSQAVDGATLARVKTKTRASLIRRLDSNSGLAGLLTAYRAIYGDWRKVFTSLDELDRVTAGDVQRVAKECFVPQKRTVAYLVGGAQ
ncbi:MAG: pitrilysin family protein [Bryobacteraceae bacterium]|jgi:predicted Zn-dependent peptidase